MKKFYQDLHVIKAPAFRFGSLFEENNIIRGNNINKSILIALPISLKESMDILSMVNSALFNELKNHKIHFYLKLHPELDFSKLKNKYHHIINEMTQVNGSFRDIIQKVDLLISNTSSVCLESLAYGTPVIVIGSQSGVTQCPIPSSLSNDMWDLCYTSKEIRKATSKLLLNNTISFKNRDKIKNYVLSNYFTDIRNDNLKSFIGID